MVSVHADVVRRALVELVHCARYSVRDSLRRTGSGFVRRSSRDHVSLSSAASFSEAVWCGVGFYLLRHQGGKIRMIAQITAFHEAIARIKTANPSFEVVGI